MGLHGFVGPQTSIALSDKSQFCLNSDLNLYSLQVLEIRLKSLLFHKQGNDFSTAGRILIDWNGRLSPSNIKEAFNLIGTLLVPHRPTHPRPFHSVARSSADLPPPPSTPALP